MCVCMYVYVIILFLIISFFLIFLFSRFKFYQVKTSAVNNANHRYWIYRILAKRDSIRHTNQLIV